MSVAEFLFLCFNRLPSFSVSDIVQDAAFKQSFSSQDKCVGELLPVRDATVGVKGLLRLEIGEGGGLGNTKS